MRPPNPTPRYCSLVVTSSVVDAVVVDVIVLVGGVLVFCVDVVAAGVVYCGCVCVRDRARACVLGCAYVRVCVWVG